MNIQEGSIIPTSKMQIPLSITKLQSKLFLGILTSSTRIEFKAKRFLRTKNKIVHFVMNNIIQEDII